MRKLFVCLGFLFCSGSIHAQTISTYVGGGLLYNPYGLATDSYGNLYIADGDAHKVYKKSPSGSLIVFAGSGSSGRGGDGGQATDAEFLNPTAVAVDAAGNVFISDAGTVRKVSTTGIITKIAGTGSFGYSGDGGAASSAAISDISGLAVDASGNLFIADMNNSVIRRVNSSGVISTYAGTGSSGFSGDGGAATSAELNTPMDIATDPSGNLFIADRNNQRIRKVTPSGTMSTIAGDGSYGGGGDGSTATTASIEVPWGVAVDASGNLFIVDDNRHNVRKVNSAGTISTYAGIGGDGGYTGDGGPATDARLYYPRSIAIDHSGNVFICDNANSAIRMVSNITNHSPVFNSGATTHITVCSNWVTSTLNSILRVSDADAGQTLTWSIASAPINGTAVVSYSAASTGGSLTPTGLSYTPTSSFSGTDSFSVQVSDGTATDVIVVYVTVNPVPAAPSVSGTSAICIGGTTSLSGSPSGGAWSQSGGTITCSSSGVVTGISGGASTVYYKVVNGYGCWTKTGYVVNVNIPGGVYGFGGGASTICPGASFTLTNASPGGTWASSNISVATVATGIVSAVAPGSDTITYTITNACGTAVARWPFKVIGVPIVSVITGYLTPLCPGGAVTLHNATSGGVWHSSTSGIAVVSSSGVVTAVAAGMDTITYSVTNSCGFTGVATKYVAVNRLPGAGTLSGPTTVANGATITLHSTESGGSWTSTNTALATVNSSGLVRGRSVGVDTIRYSVTNSCGTDIASQVVNVTAGKKAPGIDPSETGGIVNNWLIAYPNPTTGSLHLEFSDVIGQLSLRVISLSGQLVFDQKSENGISDINLEKLPSGIYLLDASDCQHFCQQKIIKQ